MAVAMETNLGCLISHVAHKCYLTSPVLYLFVPGFLKYLFLLQNINISFLFF